MTGPFLLLTDIMQSNKSNQINEERSRKNIRIANLKAEMEEINHDGDYYKN